MIRDQPIADIFEQRDGGRMTQWQKHVLGFVLPLAVSATMLAMAPEYDAPEWMINVSAGGIIIAIGYAVILYTHFARHGRNYLIAPVAIFIIGLVGGLAGLKLQSPTLVGLGGLVPLSAIMLAAGFLQRQLWKREKR
jgi:predicted cobalt transporter CbtA